MDASAYARQLAQLLPRGAAWKLEPGSWLSLLLLGLADELARIDARAEDVVEEWDPATAVETLPDWERVLGLPEAGQALPGTTEGRQAGVVRKYLASGGATPAYFVEVAARLGFTVSIDEPSAHTWRMTVQPGVDTTTQEFRVGSRVGERLSGRSNVEFEAFVNRLKPAHSVTLFVYL